MKNPFLNFHLTSLASGLLAVVAGCDVHYSNNGWSSADLTAKITHVQTNAVPAGIQSLHVDNHYGTVRVVGTDATTGSCVWTLTVNARTDDAARQLATQAAEDISSPGNSGQLNLTVNLPDEATEPHNFQSDLEIILPKSTSVQVVNGFGRVSISDLNAPVTAEDKNGPMDICDIGGAVQARTSFDSLTVSNTGAADLKNQNGVIRAFAIGGSLDAHTSFDSLTARDVHGDARLDNQNGRMEIANIDGNLDAHTSFDTLRAGDVHGSATLADQNGRVEVRRVGGKLDARTSFDSLEVADIGGPVLLRNQNGRIEASKIKGNADMATSFDRLTASDIQGDVVLENQNGEVNASGITGAVKASTSFAELRVIGAGSRFTCHDQNGAIRLDATSTALAEITAETSFDTLQVRLPAGLQPAIVAHTTFADIESDFPVLMKPHGENPFAEAAPGTPRLTLKNENGGIVVRRD